MSLELLQDALHASTADQTEIVLERIRQGVTRYATSQLHQTTVLDETRLLVRAAVGQSVGEAAGNVLTEQELRRLIEDAGCIPVRRNSTYETFPCDWTPPICHAEPVEA